jgi:class 3 adenylate cyclase
VILAEEHACGVAVHVAARIVAAAAPGELLVSPTQRRATRWPRFVQPKRSV